MSENKRTSNEVYADELSSPGPYIGRVVNNIDPMRQGSLEVELLKRVGNQPSANQQLFTVRYLSPFYGVTGVEHNGSDNYDFNHTQKSYGFWAVPPDPGTLVMVIFVDNDPGQGYWIGCVQDAYMNHMVPGLAASKNFTDTVRESDTEKWTGTTRSVKGAYGSDIEQLPVGEINRIALRNQSPQADVDANKKPIHPMADVLSSQGTVKDTVRGTHTSSARRDSPSNVYGMSTPGPIDKKTNAQKGSIGRKNNKVSTFVSRTGGHSIVMDDGNERKLRKGKPWEEPYEYVDLEAGATDGLVNFPQDESFRIRTRTGHQILLHNAEDLVYITNSRGTAWIELTSNGKIDIYAKDSISIRTEQDFNFVASRDFNVHAGRAINLFAVNTTSMSSGNDVSINSRTTTTVASEGPMNVGGNGKLTFTGQIDNFEITTKSFKVTASEVDIKSGGDMLLTGQGNVEVKAIAGSFLASSQGSMNLLTSDKMNIQQTELNLITYGEVKIGSKIGKIHLKAVGDLNMDGATTNINSGKAEAPSINAAEARAATGASLPPAMEGKTEGMGGGSGGGLTLYPLPGVGQVIVKRAPTSEPYLHHENFNPAGFTPDLTDRENPSMPYAKDSPQLEIRTPDDANNIPAELGGNAGYDGDSRQGVAGGGGGAVYHQDSYAAKMDQSHNDRINEGLLAKMPKEWASDKEFLGKVQELAGTINADFIDLLTIMMFESAWTMSPSKWNGYGYVGLIQFGSAAAQTLGTSTGALAQMSRVQQMEYVKKYYQYWIKQQKISGKLTLAQLYMLVAYPAYSNYPANQVIAARGGPREKMWAANPGWRLPPGKDSNGPITRESIGQAPARCKPYVIAQLEKAGYSVPGGSGGPGVTPNAPTAGHGAKPAGSAQTVTAASGGRASGPV